MKLLIVCSSHASDIAVWCNRVSIGTQGQRPSVSSEGQRFVLAQLKASCNLKELVVLESLRSEPTKHVDMFAAFLAPDHVLVAELDPRSDNLNARVLDWNAKKLASLKVDGKPMRVDRIRIPPRQGESWSTYTNAIFTDRLVLMPVMKTDERRIASSALSKYRQLLPNHHIATIDISSMKNLQGSLHCMSLNLPAFAPLPDGAISFDRAKEIANRVRSNPASANSPQAANDRRYSIDKKLRRIFKSSADEHLVDAYAVGLVQDVVTLLRADDNNLVRVKITGVCKTDQYWLRRNAEKIRANGANVQRYVLSKKR